jgi:hypothetical protein
MFKFKKTQLPILIMKLFCCTKIESIYVIKDTQKKKIVVKFNINKPFNPKYDKKNQLNTTDKKNNKPK